jgi:hypothetical protein
MALATFIRSTGTMELLATSAEKFNLIQEANAI